MLKVEVHADTVRTIQSKAGKVYRLQALYVYTLTNEGKPQPHPVRAEFFLHDKESPPAPGAYLLAPASIYVDRQGRFAVAPKLVPIAAK